MKPSTPVCPYCKKDLKIIKEKYDLDTKVKELVCQCNICLRYIYIKDCYSYKMLTLDYFGVEYGN